MRQALLSDRGKRHVAALFGIIIFILLSMLGAGLTSRVAFANDLALRKRSTILDGCPLLSEPSRSSVLLVLLDRSGSLVATDGNATDPNGYSTSITRALADLWPGIMIVVPFGDPHLNGANLGVPVLPVYKANLSDATQRERLKAQVKNYPIMGGTPLAPAMSEALDAAKVPELQNPAPGSRAIIITDGGPTSTTQYPDQTAEKQIQELTSNPNLISQFHDRCVPVSPFGLKTDANADRLLGQIAKGTGGQYTPVHSPEELAEKVIELYKDWRGLSLSRPPIDTNGSYSVFINDFASHADIVTFRSDDSYQVQLFGSDGKTPISGIQPRSIDVHYQIYGLDIPPSSTGTYKVKVLNGNEMADSGAQVYALANYPRLQVTLIGAESTSFYANQPLTIKAALFKDQKQYVPTSVATLSADITYHMDGKADKTFTQNLDSQDGQGVFSHSFPASTFPRAGQLRIVVHATYQGIQKDSEVYTVPLLHFCNKGQLQCFWEEHQPLVLAVGIPGGLVLLLLIGGLIWYAKWRKLPEPYGYLVNVNNESKVLALDTHRPQSAYFFSKSVIMMQELAEHPQGITVANPLLGEPLAFVATDTGIYLRLMQNTSSTVSVMTNTGEQKFSGVQREIPLGSRSEIRKNGIPAVIFQQMVPRNLPNIAFLKKH